MVSESLVYVLSTGPDSEGEGDLQARKAGFSASWAAPANLPNALSVRNVLPGPTSTFELLRAALWP